MSGFQPGRRGPNVSQYIAGLNQIPSDTDFAQEDYNFDDDLALFTNTEFVHNDIIDFDLDFDFTQTIPGEEEYLKQTQTPAALIIDHAAPPLASAIPAKKQKLSPRSAKAKAQNTASGITQDTSNKSVDLTGVAPIAEAAAPESATIADMNFNGDYNFHDVGLTPQLNTNIPYNNSTYGFDVQSPFDAQQLNTPVTTPPNGQTGVRPQGVMPDAALLEASSRAAAEEDKRRRNTAASARFRYKKKQREQALEKSAKDMTDKLDKLEEKINQLEKENTWLRGLVVERTAKTSEEMAELMKTFKDEERSKESPKKGVGTAK